MKEETMILRTLTLSLVALALHTPVWAGPTLTVNANRELEITAQDGTPVARLITGSIGKQITADNQVFKVSYGKDLRGRTNIIVYPDPEKPQALDLTILGQSVKISSDAVLTVIDDGSGSLSQFQSGMVGTVTVAGQPLTAGASAKAAQGAITPVAANEKVFPDPPKPTSSSPGSAADEPVVETATYAGAKVRMVEGDVLFAPPGRDVLEMVKTASDIPRLQAEQTLVSGSSIQTGPNGKAMISPFPGAVIAVQPNSKLTLEDLRYEKSNGDYDRKVILNLKEGGVISTLKGIKPQNLDYQVKTPLAVAAARGTVYGVWGDPAKTLVIVSESLSEVTVQGDSPFTIKVLEGNKLLITRDGAPQTFTATAEELRAFNDLVNSIRDLLSSNDISATGESIGQSGGTSPELEEAIRNLQRVFQPRLNDFFMTPITSPANL
jgi:hypothetical protein